MSKKCIVSSCQTNSDAALAAKKIFFTVPISAKRRAAWFKCCGMDYIPRGHAYFCCEDHFDLPNDTKNWIQYKMMRGTKLQLKEQVLPHKKLLEEAVDEFVLPPKVPKLSSDISQDFQHLGPSNIPQSAPPMITEDINRPGPSKVKKAHWLTALSTSSDESAFKSSADEGSPFKSSADEDMGITKKVFLEERRRNTTFEVIEKNSRFYLGLPKHIYILVTFITQWENITHRDILITLKKIRLDDVYFRLAVDFGISITTVHRAFVTGVKKGANVMQNFIFNPSKMQILAALPLPFRFRYSNISYIIDCFEIEIEKPSNPVKQSFTWSEYKKCNTVKYLLSATPHGFINFVSQGFGGRISDNAIVKASGFLDVVKDTAVMADRGFKNVAQLLSEKNCILVRPPSVGEKALGKQEIKEAKRIAALRIHIERTIVRIREFRMLDAHEKINSSLLDLTDEIVIIACGIINLQGPLIKNA